jgi:hypothetical protein
MDLHTLSSSGGLTLSPRLKGTVKNLLGSASLVLYTVDKNSIKSSDRGLVINTAMLSRNLPEIIRFFIIFVGEPRARDAHADNQEI